MTHIILYSQGSGSRQIELLAPFADLPNDAIKRHAIRYLRASCATPGSIEFLEHFPFQLFSATNDFCDQFEILTFFAPMQLYVDIENEVGVWKDRINYGVGEIAKAFESVGHPLRFVAVHLDLSENVASVPEPKLVVTSAIVEEALQDAATLIANRGAANGLDRVHTVFHAYLEAVCEKSGITVKPDASITTLFSQIRQNHSALAITDPEEKRRIDQVLRGMAQIVDALDPIRNHKTLAHPNSLLPDAEAMLTINLVRSMLQYLDTRLS